MKTRAAIQVEHHGPLVIDDLEVPTPKPDQVIVKIFYSGVCHSQLHQIHSSELQRPLVMGHEATGVVTHKGKEVTHVNEGDHVIVTWVPRTLSGGRMKRVFPGTQYKGKPVHDVHVHTLAEDVLLKEQYVVPIPKDEPTDVTSIIGCAVLTGAGAVLNTARVRPGDSVAVYGVGGVGLSAVGAAAVLDAYPIIAVDLRDDKLDFAKEFGATHVVNSSSQDPVEAILEISGGGVDYAFDAIGVRLTTEQILPSTRPGGPGADNQGGTAVLIGIPGGEMTLDPGMFMHDHRQYRGSLGATYPDRDFPMFLRWHHDGKFPLDKLVTRRYKLDEINEAFKELAAGEILGRAIVEVKSV